MSFEDTQNYYQTFRDPQGNFILGIRKDGAVVFPDGTWHNSGLEATFQVASSDVAISVVSPQNAGDPIRDEGTVIITKGSQAHLTCAAPIAGSPFAGGNDGFFLRVIGSTNFAHVVTFPSNSIQTPAGLKTTITMVPGGAALSFSMMAYNGLWYLYTLTGGTAT